MNRSHLRNRFSFAAVASAVLLASSTLRAQTYTWMGPSPDWNTATNWSPVGIPNSSSATVNFTGTSIGIVNISSSVQSQSLNFSNSIGEYTLTSSPGVVLSGVTGINVAANVTGMQTINLASNAAGNLVFPSGNNLTITNNSTAPGTTLLIGASTVIGTSGSGGVFVNGPGNTTIVGGFATGLQVFGGLHKNGTGTLTLSNFVNNYDGNTFVNGGTLQLGAGTAIPTGSSVTVAAGSRFNTGGLSNSFSSAINTLALNGGTFRVPSGAGDYYLRQVTMAGNSTVDFTGTSNFGLHFVNSGAGITVSGVNNNWIGSGTSRIQNDTGASLPITFAAGSSLTLGVILSGSQFQFTGTAIVTLTNTGNTAGIINNAFLFTNDLSTNVGSGAFGTLGAGLFTNNVSLQYTGGTATSAKSITLGGTLPVIQVNTPGANLTMNGTLSGSGGLHAAGPGTLTLTAANSYLGNTQVSTNGILAIPTIADASAASPIGTGSGISLGTLSARGTLLLTGTNPSYSTDRGLSVAGSFTSGNGGAINVQNAGTTLTLAGQVSGSGSVIKTGPGTLLLGSNLNGHTGGTYVEAGTLRLAAPLGIPFLGNMTVASGAVFDNGGFGTGGGDTIGAVTLNGGTFRATTGAGAAYYLNRLVMNGGGVDLTGSIGGLALNQAGASITINSDSSWIGPPGAYVGNNFGAELPITIAPNAILTSSVSLASFPPFSSNPFLITGGGTLHLTSVPVRPAHVRVNQVQLRMDGLGNVSSALFDLTLDNGTLAYGGPTQSYPAQFTIGSGGGNIDVMSVANTLTVTGAISGAGPFTKSGPGTLSLMNSANQFSGVLVNAGRLEVGDDNQLGTANPIVNALGTLRYTAGTTTARTFHLNNGSLEAPSSGALILNGATVAGGFLRGAGFYNLTGGSSLVGATTFSSTTLNVIGPASMSNFTSNGTLLLNAGQTLAMNYATNGAPGLMAINGTANVSDFTSYGRMQINPGGTLSNTQGPLVFAGGSVTNVGIFNPANQQVTPGGTINIGAFDMRVHGGLVRNNGTISGTGNLVIDFGGVVRGAGEIDVDNIIRLNGGQLLAGNSPGLSRVASLPLSNGGPTGGDFSNATGIAGPPIGSTGTQLSGWSVFEYGNSTNTGGFLRIEGTPASRAIWQFRTVVNGGDYSTAGVPANFNAAQGYTWQILRPRSNADAANPNNTTPINFVAEISILDTATMATVPLNDANLNSYLRFDDTLWNWGAVPVSERGTFAFVLLPDALGAANRVIGLTYTPVPEPVTILAVAGLGLAIGHHVLRRPTRSAAR